MGLIVPDSPEETWSGNDSSRRPLELPRTRPPASNIEEWFVPETPDETWASPRKLSPIVLPSTKLEELIVPDSPEESKGTFHRSGTLRRIGLSKVRLVGVKCLQFVVFKPFNSLVCCRLISTVFVSIILGYLYL